MSNPAPGLPPSWASCSPSASYTSTTRFMLPMHTFWTPSAGRDCQWGLRLFVPASPAVRAGRIARTGWAWLVSTVWCEGGGGGVLWGIWGM